ncbi:MAG: S-layer homology domain-containing protein [Ruminococcaceae bacterium]|nr:S-layer homology domain-containing protein [Oscillospiraceae bacterium]
MDGEVEKEILSEVISGTINVYGVTFENKNYKYDGNEKEIAVSGILPAGTTVEYYFENTKLDGVFSAKKAGTYDVLAIVKQAGKEDKELNATLTIEPKEITAEGMSAQDKVYDGTTATEIVGGELVGIVQGDDVNAVFPENGNFISVNVGEDIEVEIEPIVVSGEDKDNYKLIQPEKLFADICKCDVIVEAVDIIAKTATLVGVIDADTEAVEIDFDKLDFEVVEDAIPEDVIPVEAVEGEIPEENIPGEDTEEAVVTVKITNFVLKGEKADNYNVTTEELETTVSEDAVATVSVTATNGTVTGEGTYLIGSEVTLVAEADEGYKFSGWYAGEESVSDEVEYTFILEADAELIAKFTKKLTGGSGGGGMQAAGDMSRPKDEEPEVKPEVKPEIPETTTPEVTPSAPAGFADLSGYDWAKDAINALAESGIIKGTSETTFAPGKNITRADYVALIVRLFELTSENNENFADVNASDYFAAELAIARNNGIVGGIGDNKFAPRGNITRQDMMVMLYRAMTKMNIELKADAVSAEDFDEVSDYAKEAVSALVSNGIINGKNGKIDPKANTTRAEVAVMLSRVLEYVK